MSFRVDQHAEACHNLMQKLGYDEYGESVTVPEGRI